MNQFKTVLATCAALIAGCGGSSGGGPRLPPNLPPPPPPPPVSADFQEMSASNLPTASLGGLCMDADQGDVDGDGDVDIALAQEFATNIILINDGAGVFTVANVPGGNGDNEDVRLRDIDGDTDLDMLTVHEDDGVHALFHNDGAGNFTDMSASIPLNSVANAAEVTDVDGDTRPDILLGNRGTNNVLLQQANGTYIDDTANRPIGGDITQDLLLIDVEDDGDLDLFVANETDNRLFINDGNGNYSDETAVRLPGNDGETREADAADIDGDGDFDIIIGNVDFNSGRPIQNQLLRNNGNGVFSDDTATALANVVNAGNSFTIKFFDIDADGDPDILSPNNTVGQGGNIEVWINDGTGTFSMAATSPFSSAPSGSAFDIEIVDVNADGRDDVYFCYRSGTDQLYIRN